MAPLQSKKNTDCRTFGKSVLKEYGNLKEGTKREDEKELLF